MTWRILSLSEGDLCPYYRLLHLVFSRPEFDELNQARRSLFFGRIFAIYEDRTEKRASLTVRGFGREDVLGCDVMSVTLSV